jgi:mRNA-degrading endonuclease RelE of RelBE toxin-antitoxin system
VPGRFTVKLTPSFQKDLEALSRKEQDRILKSLEHLESEPFTPPPLVKKLKGQGIGQWRLRGGVYRVRYDVLGRDVVLYRVRHRKDVYKV